jgi:4,4'-diapolycopenoate synthase
VTSAKAALILNRARKAQPAWATLDVSRRCDTLGNLRREIAGQCESIADSIAQETSKPVLDALSGDVLVTLQMMRYYEASAAKILRSRRIGKPAFFFRGTRFEQHFEPHGVALIFGPSNYPFQLSLIPMVTALAAGNAVVLKCSERTPETAALIAKLCAKADLPCDLVQVVCDDAEESASLIDACPDILFFTGSSHNGRKVAERAAQHLVPVVLELGGKDASLVFADCHLERTVEGITYGAFANGGRVCVGIKRTYVEASIYDEFVAHLVQRVDSLRVGPGPDTDLRSSSMEMHSSLRGQVEDALARGATLHYPKNHSAIGTLPVLLSAVPDDARILSEETFGPVLCVAPFADEAQALALANGCEFALSSSVWTRNRTRARRIALQLSAGSCAVNDVIRVIANPCAAFGGNRQSGYGRYHGPEGLRAFSRIKSISLTRNRRAREINWFPFTSRTRSQLALLIRTLYGRRGLAASLRHLLLSLLVGTGLVISMPAQPQAETHLSINVRLTPDAHGEAGYLIFNSSSGFPGDKNKAIRHGFVAIAPGARELHIDTALPPNSYAVTVYEDLNINHKLDHNLIGIPSEPVGASNNPKVHMRPPRFDESSFHLGANPQTIIITLVRGL